MNSFNNINFKDIVSFELYNDHIDNDEGYEDLNIRVYNKQGNRLNFHYNNERKDEFNINELRKMINLKSLSIYHYDKLREIPETLMKLRKLELNHCKNIKEISDSLTNIEELSISYCVNLRDIPKTFIKLNKIDIKNNYHLINIPENIIKEINEREKRMSKKVFINKVIEEVNEKYKQTIIKNKIVEGYKMNLKSRLINIKDIKDFKGDVLRIEEIIIRNPRYYDVDDNKMLPKDIYECLIVKSTNDNKYYKLSFKDFKEEYLKEIIENKDKIINNKRKHYYIYDIKNNESDDIDYKVDMN